MYPRPELNINWSELRVNQNRPLNRRQLSKQIRTAQQFLVLQESATSMCVPTSLVLSFLLAEEGRERVLIAADRAQYLSKPLRREWIDQTYRQTSRAIAFCRFRPAIGPSHLHRPVRQNSSQAGRALHPIQI